MMDEAKMLMYLKAGAMQRIDMGSPEAVPPFVPARVRMKRTVRSDVPGGAVTCLAGREYFVTSNRWGAVTAITNGDQLGLKPGEFEVLEWAENTHRGGEL